MSVESGLAIPFHRWAFRKLTVRPVRFLETHYWYPVRERIDRLPPIPTAATARDGVLLILATPRSWLDAIWSAWSYLRFLGDALHLTIACDGPPPSRLSAAADRLFPGSDVLDVRAFVDSLDDGDALRRFAAQHPFGRKLRLLLAMQQRSAVLYSDSDILVHNPPTELLEHLERRASVPLYMRSESRCEDPWVVRRAGELGMALDCQLNAGQLWLPRGCLDARKAAEILTGWTADGTTHFAEQNVVSALITQAGGVGLPIDRYVANAQRMFYFERDVDYEQLACRHYVNLIRNLMYSRGIPRLLREVEGGAPSSRVPRPAPLLTP